MVDKFEEGVFVAGIVNDDSNPFNPPTSPYPWEILEDGLGDHVLANDLPHIFHHKYMISDPHDLDSDPFVWTGSYNWTNSAQFRNDENTLVIHDGTIANIYYQSFVEQFKALGGTVLIYTGIDETEANWNVKMYPNPAQDVLYLQFAATQITDMDVSITDMTGRTVYTNSMNNVQIQQLQIQTADLPNGMYILQVNGQAERFVISR